MATLNLASLLLLICCIASAIEAHSVPLVEAPTGDREAKNLLYVPYRPTLLHAYGPETRYGLGSRQTNSPINPSIAQNGLGPFFGYFPNLLTQPCPAAEKCAECQIPTTTEMPLNNNTISTTATTIAPVTCPSFEKITKECPSVVPYATVVGSNGILELNMPAIPGFRVSCLIKFISIYDDNKIEIKCTDILDGVNLIFADTVATPTTLNGKIVKDTLYTTEKGEVQLSIDNSAATGKNLQVTCTWKSVKPA